MPNWCVTDNIITGNEKDIQDLLEKLEHLSSMEKPLVESDFGKMWLGCVVELFGVNWTEIDCRGYITTICMLDKNTLQIQTETAWDNPKEVWELVTSNFESMSYFYYAEELGCSYFVTNDTEGKFFPERYYVEQIEMESDYFENDLDLFDHISQITEKLVTNMEEMNKVINEYNSENEDTPIYVNEITVLQ